VRRCDSRAALGVLAAAAALVACSHSSSQGGVPVSGTDLSCGASRYISGDACVDLPPFSDASVSFDASDDDADASGDDAGASGEVGPSDAEGGLGDVEVSNVDGASDDASDAPSPDPLAPCAVANDVFFVHSVYAIDVPTMDETFTNLDSTFQAGAPPPLQITATPDAEPPVVLTVALANDGGVPTGALPTPGTYATGAPGIFVSLSLEGVDVAYDRGRRPDRHDVRSAGPAAFAPAHVRAGQLRDSDDQRLRAVHRERRGSVSLRQEPPGMSRSSR
jgi:hypothetical protein